MSFFDDIFGKSLPGGTPAGNLLRKVSRDISGGVLGNGAMLISQVDYDQQNLSDADYVAKYGKTKTGVTVEGVTPDSSIMAVDQQRRMGVNKSPTWWITVKSLARRYWFLVIPALIVLLVWVLTLIARLFNTKSKPYGKIKKRK